MRTRLRLTAPLTSGVALLLGAVLLTIGCDRNPDFTIDVAPSAADERPEPAQETTTGWDDSRESEDWDWESSSTEPDAGELAGEFARALASASSGDDASRLRELAVDSSPLELRVELPWQGKEPHQVTASYPSLEQFTRCLPWNRGDEDLPGCEVDESMSSTLLGFRGSVADSVSTCSDGCCRFSISGPVTDKLKIHELCYDTIDDGRLALTELTFAAY